MTHTETKPRWGAFTEKIKSPLAERKNDFIIIRSGEFILKNFIIITCFVIFLTSITNWAHAGMIGIVKQVKGKAFIVITKDVIQPLTQGDPVHLDTKIKTGKRSFVRVRMNDKSIFSLGPESIFHFEKYKQQKKKGKVRSLSIYHLLQGKLRGLFKDKKVDYNAKVKTPNVAMGIRGTEFFIDVRKKGKELETDIALVSGKLVIDISHLNLGVKTIDLSPGMIFDSSARHQKLTPGKEVFAFTREISPSDKKQFKPLERFLSRGEGIPLRHKRRRRRNFMIGAPPPPMPQPNQTPLPPQQMLQQQLQQQGQDKDGRLMDRLPGKMKRNQNRKRPINP